MHPDGQHVLDWAGLAVEMMCLDMGQHGALETVMFSDCRIFIHFSTWVQNMGGYFNKCIQGHTLFLLPQFLIRFGTALNETWKAPLGCSN